MREKTKITDIAFGGKGVGKLSDGRVVFVPFTVLDEEIEIGNIKNKPKYSEAELISVLKESEHRITPVCKYYTICGGCQYMHVSYEQEIKYKTKQLKDNLVRIGRSGNDLEIQVIKSNQELFYRNSLSLQKQKQKLGFYSVCNDFIVDIEKCMLADNMLNEFICKNRNKILKRKEKIITLKADKKNISFAGNKIILQEKIGNYNFQFDYNNFFQTNILVFSEIISVISKDLACNKNKILFDLYSGVGIYSICFSQYFEKVFGIEENNKSIDLANKNKENLKNIKFYKGKVEKKYPLLLKDKNIGSHTIIVNPPRAGIKKSVVSLFNTLDNISKVIYVSCNPSTLSRDIACLTLQGKYKVNKIYLFDMFPRTKFFETVVILGKTEKKYEN